MGLVDERWVDPDQDGSNERFIRQYLLQGCAARAKFFTMKNQLPSAVEGRELCEQLYQTIPAPFDLTLLGMGLDGHTASWFPRAQGLDKGLDMTCAYRCCAINAVASEVTGVYTERMSLSLYGVLQSRQIMLLITGEDKLRVYQRAKSTSRLNIASLPVSAVLSQQEVPVRVYWAP